MGTSYTAKQFIDTFIFDEATKLDASGCTYTAFVLLSIGVEILGHCLYKGNWGNSGGSEETFMKAISEFTSLKKYSCYDYIVKEKGCQKKCFWRPIHNLFHQSITKTKNRLYTEVRCGLAHKLLNGIVLCHGNDDDNNSVIGYKDFYKNVHDAWLELQSPSFSGKLKKNLSDVIFYTDNTTSSSGRTSYDVTTYGNA